MKKPSYKKWLQEFEFALKVEYQNLETDLTFEEYCKEEYNKIK